MGWTQKNDGLEWIAMRWTLFSGLPRGPVSVSFQLIYGEGENLHSR
jgi:hypothetical protein